MTSNCSVHKHFWCPIPRSCVKLPRLWTYSFQSTVQQTLVSSVSRMLMAHTYFIQNIVIWLVSSKTLSDRDVLCLQVFRVWWSMTRSWSLGEQTMHWWRPKPRRWPRKLWQPWGALVPCACRPRLASPHGQGITGALLPSRFHRMLRPLFNVFCLIPFIVLTCLLYSACPHHSSVTTTPQHPQSSSVPCLVFQTPVLYLSSCTTSQTSSGFCCCCNFLLVLIRRTSCRQQSLLFSWVVLVLCCRHDWMQITSVFVLGSDSFWLLLLLLLSQGVGYLKCYVYVVALYIRACMYFVKCSELLKMCSIKMNVIIGLLSSRYVHVHCSSLQAKVWSEEKQLACVQARRISNKTNWKETTRG